MTSVHDLVSPRIPGDYQLILSVAASLDDVAFQAGDAAAQLRNSSDSVSWTGASADEFRHHLDSLPRDLQKVHDSFQAAAGALKAYGNSLAGLQSGYPGRVQTLQNHLDDRVRTQRQRDSAASSGSDTSRLDQTLADLDYEIQIAINSVWSLFNDAASQAWSLRSQLDGAAGLGITNDFGNTMGRYGGDVADAAKWGWDHTVGKLIADVQQLVKDVAQLINDIQNGNWDALVGDVHALCKDLNSVLSDLATVLQFVPGLGEILDIALLATALIALGTGVVLYAQGKESLGELGGDAFSVVDSAISVRGDIADKAAKQKIASFSAQHVGFAERGVKVQAAATKLQDVAHLRSGATAIRTLPTRLHFSNLKNLRGAWAENRLRSAIVKDPSYAKLSFVNVFGQKIHYCTFKKIAFVTHNAPTAYKFIAPTVHPANSGSGHP